MSPDGVLHSLSTVHRPPVEAYSDRTPYTVALVEVDDGGGLVLLGRLNGEGRIGDHVRGVVVSCGCGASWPVFEREDDQAHTSACHEGER